MASTNRLFLYRGCFHTPSRFFSSFIGKTFLGKLNMSIFFFTIIPIYVPFVCSKMLFETNDDGCMPALSWRQRWYGFAFCFCFGSITSLFSSLALVKRDIPSFAFLYTFGNLISICSTGFVWGPKNNVLSACLRNVLFRKKHWAWNPQFYRC